MTAECHVELRLRVAPADDPIRGLLVDDRGHVQPFHGWMELIAAVDAALEHDPDPDDRGDR